ncbi:MAG: hypothetical protein JWM59_3643 [Verrucomicrobiales bacterium]|nr:hypothetical protein [Verrucomicrobiales bacterium]
MDPQNHLLLKLKWTTGSFIVWRNDEPTHALVRLTGRLESFLVQTGTQSEKQGWHLGFDQNPPLRAQPVTSLGQ